IYRLSFIYISSNFLTILHLLHSYTPTKSSGPLFLWSHLRQRNRNYLTNVSRNDQLFSCNMCMKLRPRNAFADKQLRARRGKGHIESDRRFCLDCGCRNKMYQPGQFFKVDGREEVLCAICRERCRYGQYCTYCCMCEGSTPAAYTHPTLTEGN
ncbi:hypothetical protein N7460_001456, partial [Penicillium canescens]